MSKADGARFLRRSYRAAERRATSQETAEVRELSPEERDPRPVRATSATPIAFNTGVEDWEGRHGEPGDTSGDVAQPPRVVDALVLRRVSN